MVTAAGEIDLTVRGVSATRCLPRLTRGAWPCVDLTGDDLHRLGGRDRPGARLAAGRGERGDLRLAAAGPVLRVLNLVGIDQLIEVHPSVTDAVASLPETAPNRPNAGPPPGGQVTGRSGHRRESPDTPSGPDATETKSETAAAPSAHRLLLALPPAGRAGSAAASVRPRVPRSTRGCPRSTAGPARYTAPGGGAGRGLADREHEVGEPRGRRCRRGSRRPGEPAHGRDVALPECLLASASRGSPADCLASPSCTRVRVIHRPHPSSNGAVSLGGSPLTL